MASTFTKGLNLEMPASGDQEHIWDQTMRDNWAKLDKGTSREAAIIITGAMTLTQDQMGNAVLRFTGTPTPTVLSTVPEVVAIAGVPAVIAADGSITTPEVVAVKGVAARDITEVRVTLPNTIARVLGIINDTNQPLTFIQGSGGDAVIAAGARGIITCNGTGAGAAVVDISGDHPHSSMSHRDAADAHPTSAITGLDTALANTKDQGVRVKYIPADELGVAATGGAIKSKVAIGAITFEMIQFSARVVSEAGFSIMLPKSWDAGNINLRFIWHVSTAVTGNVIMRHAYMPVIDGGTLGAIFGGAALATLPAPAAVDTINISKFSRSVKASGYFNTKGSLLNFHIYRDGTSVDDTFVNSLYLLGVELQYVDDAKTDA